MPISKSEIAFRERSMLVLERTEAKLHDARETLQAILDHFQLFAGGSLEEVQAAQRKLEASIENCIERIS